MTHKPKYMCWYEEDFWADRYVSQMPRQARHFYRALLQAALFCPTRPYLPDDDTVLAMYADADPQDWQTHKTAVLYKFTKEDVGGKPMWSHHRLDEQWDIIQKQYEQWSQAGKRSGQARQPKNQGSIEVEQAFNDRSTDDQRQLNNSGCGIGFGTGTGNGFGLKNSDTTTVIDRNDVVSKQSGSKSSSKPKTPKPVAETTDCNDRQTDGLDEAEKLVEILHTMLSQRAEVRIPANYAGLWLPDFEGVLEHYKFEDVRLAVLYSQLPKNQKYYVRAKGICDSVDSLIEQVLKPANQKACELRWKQAVGGKLPPPSSAVPPKTITERLRGNCCQECPDGVPAHAPGECPDPDEGQAFEIEEDLGS